MTKQAFIDALWTETRENAAYAYHYATAVSKQDLKDAMLYASSTLQQACKARHKTKRASINRTAREEAYRSCGLIKVKGALGGTYWE